MTTPSSARPTPPAWQRRLRSIVVFLGFALVGGAVGYLGAGLADRGGLLPAIELGRGDWLVFALLALPLWFLVVLAHEAGHLAGGAIAGFRPALLIVGPLRVTWLDGRPRLGLNRSLSLAGGLASAVPAHDRELSRGMLLMVAGGPLGSLAIGLLALAALPLAGGVAWLLLLLVAALGIFITLATLVPVHAGGFSSDGARIAMLLRGGPAAERWCASALLVGASLAGRLADASPALVERATALRDGSVDAAGAAFLAYGYHLARGDHAAAGEQLAYAMDQLDAFAAGVRPALLVEAAYFAARHQGDPARARGYLERTTGASLVEPYTRRRAEAAVLHAEGRHDEARAAAAAGQEALHKARVGPMGATEAQLLDDLRYS